MLFGAQGPANWASVDASVDLVCSSERERLFTGVSGQPGRATRVHQGARVLDLRTLAGATVGASSIHRTWRNPTPGGPSGIAAKGAACSFGQDEPRSPTPFAVFEITDDRWVSGGLSPIGSGLSGAGLDRPFGKAVHQWESL